MYHGYTIGPSTVLRGIPSIRDAGVYEESTAITSKDHWRFTIRGGSGPFFRQDHCSTLIESFSGIQADNGGSYCGYPQV
ncbi:hypothetical protein J6590_049640, partial [Homalodisca vitripennis]